MASIAPQNLMLPGPVGKERRGSDTYLSVLLVDTHLMEMRRGLTPAQVMAKAVEMLWGENSRLPLVDRSF